jgi:hypothetical protein
MTYNFDQCVSRGFELGRRWRASFSVGVSGCPTATWNRYLPCFQVLTVQQPKLLYSTLAGVACQPSSCCAEACQPSTPNYDSTSIAYLGSRHLAVQEPVELVHELHQRRDLEGYRAYREKVGYRLMPHVW